ncbi:MAG TPA: hypothetical protein VGQ57_05795 [Polyangiaceae bacterium]|nr:hypothetical protein [Polyangiaceae bacterium]
MIDEDPPRLLDPGSDASPELQSLFRAGAADLPSDAQIAALAAKLGPVLAPNAGAPVAPSSTALGVKAGVGVAVAVAAVALFLLLRPKPEGAPRPAPARNVPSVNAPVPPPAPSPPPRAPEETAALPSAPASDAPAASPARPTVASPSRPTESEAEFLERARGALGKNPSQALALANLHRSRFPGGVLAQEREVIAIEALKRLGRTEEATRRAADFARRYPGSAYRLKLDSHGSP